VTHLRIGSSKCTVIKHMLLRTLAKSDVLESMPHISEIPWCCVIFILIKRMAKLNYLLNNKAESLC
jgi:hypothetical protein